MTNLSLLGAPELAAVLESSIQRLGQLGQAGIDALVERLASAPDRMDFDAGVDLLNHWIGDHEVSSS